MLHTLWQICSCSLKLLMSETFAKAGLAASRKLPCPALSILTLKLRMAEGQNQLVLAPLLASGNPIVCLGECKAHRKPRF